ncbi:leucine-rich repeat-containing protein 71 [Brachyistius frenatus]|uniref:leucine-rich repeat-containing protein 71 n=1 Tax=Brachyistius frenatus TaxID=100188 RepID=UPI0037E9A42C
MSRKRHIKEKANTEDEALKNTGPTINEPLPAQTFEEYQCSGNVEIDFPGLCALLDLKDIPAVSTKHPTAATDTDGHDMVVLPEEDQSQTKAAPLWSKPYLQVELESEDHHSAKSMKVSGWRVNELTFQALQKLLPSMSQLQSLQFWQAGLTDRKVISLVSTMSLCSSLRFVTLEGNALPEQSYHLLLSEDSGLTHLSLRNNRIGDEGARLIGLALSTTTSANKNLLSLNLAFNSVGDAGAAYIAQGLRLNRALLFLSLSDNQIGDSGAAHLAAVLCEFALTHEEVVERRKLFLQKIQSPLPRLESDQSSSDQLLPLPNSTPVKGENKGSAKKKEASKKEEKPAASKENPKSNRKTSDLKASHSKGGKLGGKERQLSVQEDKLSGAPNEEELVEIVNPLLDQVLNHRDGQLFLPGNNTLTSLNLAGNRLTEKSLPLFLATLEMQGEGGGLLRLCLQRNHFPTESECYVKIKELMLALTQDKNNSEHTEEEGQGAQG